MLVVPTDEELMIEVARVLDHRIRDTPAVLPDMALPLPGDGTSLVLRCAAI